MGSVGWLAPVLVVGVNSRSAPHLLLVLPNLAGRSVCPVHEPRLRADALEGWSEPGHSWQCSLLDGNECHDWQAMVHLQLLAKTGFPFLPSASSRGNAQCMLNACCESGHHRAHWQRSGARRPWRTCLLVSTAGSARNTHAIAEHLRIRRYCMLV